MRRFQPVGETDSEYAFCYLLGRLAPLWEAGDEAPSLDERMATVADVAAELRRLGPANFLYSDGSPFSRTRTGAFGTRAGGRFSDPRPPGPGVGQSKMAEIVGGLDVRTAADRVDIACLASVPLTDGGWSPLPEGTLIALEDGREVARAISDS